MRLDEPLCSFNGVLCVRVSKAKTALPLPVKRALRKLGTDISIARRRRKIPTTLMAQRAFIDRRSLARVEKGDPGVSMAIYASVLFILGLADRLADLASPGNDPIGQRLADERLPQRVYQPRRPATESTSTN
jgi:hypothetical protein